jgi:nicotinate-nucleotide pyrophosphorylase (carboxylating)
VTSEIRIHEGAGVAGVVSMANVVGTADVVGVVDAADVVGVVDAADVVGVVDAADVVGVVDAADVVGVVDAADVVGADVVGVADGGIGGETAERLRAAGLEADAVVRVVRAALDEDFRYGPDVTSAATVAGRRVTADVVAREVGVLAGVPVALVVLDLIAEYLGGGDAGDDDGGGATGGGERTGNEGRPAAGDGRVSATVLVGDGSRVGSGDAVLRVSGPAEAVLGAERTMLNFLTHLSGIATATRAWADAIAGTDAMVRDTRKTTPGLRVLEKYAVRCGGGQNHRMGLGDAALIKDNHVAAAGGVAAAVMAVRSAAERSAGARSVERSAGAGAGAGAGAPGAGAAGGGLVIEVECDSLAQVREALAAGARFLLLDNMDVDSLRAAVAVGRAYDDVWLEASGRLRLANAREVAETGVDYLAVGALTHSSRALDLGLDYAAEG